MRTLTNDRVLSGYKDLASFLGVSTKTIQRHLKSMPITRIGKKILILESDLVAWVQKKANGHTKKKSPLTIILLSNVPISPYQSPIVR